MKYLEILRAKLAELSEARAAAFAEMEAITEQAATESRSELNETEAPAFDEARGKVTSLDAEITSVEERVAELVKIEERAALAAKAPQFIKKTDPTDVLEDRSATSMQLADAVVRSVSDTGTDTKQLETLLRRHRADRDWTRSILARSREVYAEAWSKYVTGREMEMSVEERAAMSVGSNTNGGYLVPTHLDPTIILTNDGTSNAIRAISKVVTLTDGSNVWNGVTSAGVTASWDGELVEVSDDTPTFGNPSIPVHKAQALLQASIEAFEDINGLASDALMLFADAKDRLEGAAHATGSGSGQPTGIFTALDANTNVELTSTTAATIGKVDLNTVYRSVPVRFRSKSKWLMNPLYALAIHDLGTAVSASYSGDLREGPAGTILNHEVVESDDAPTTQTTTVRDNEIVFGDFSNYVIVDKPGSTAIEFIPHLFNTSNNLPDGRRAWYMHFRSGADSVNDVAFRLLQDKTSA